MKRAVTVTYILIVLLATTAFQNLAVVEGEKQDETKVLTIIKKFVIWIRDNIDYKVHGLLPYYPNETYAKGEGDCDDQANLFITLCRIYGIPAFLQVGCIYLSTQRMNETFWEGHVTLVYERIGWHGWAVVYVPPWGWLPFDFTYVISGLDDPLDAMKQAAVVAFQEVIQYANITKTDYVASYKETKDFLRENYFYVYERNEMTQEVSQGDFVSFVIQVTRTFSNSGTGKKIWNLTAEERTINLFMNNTWQTVQLINSSVPLENMTVDEDGNPIAFLQLPQSELKPGENVSYAVTYRALSKPRSLPNITQNESKTLEEIPKDLKANYTGAAGPWLVNNQELQGLAHNIAQNGKEIVDNTSKWVLVATVVTIVAVVGLFLYVRKLKRETKRSYLPSEEPSSLT